MKLCLAILLVALAGAASAQAPSPVGPQTLTPRSSPVPTAQSAEEIIIKQKLRAEGLRHIKGLVREPDGTWRGQAVRDQAEVAVKVDTDGNVSFQ